MSQQPIAGPSNPSTSPQSFWKPTVDIEPRLKQIRRSLDDSTHLPRLRISRVAQLDADLLDHELETILAAPMGKALQDIRMPGSGGSWEPELMALLRTAVLKMSIYDRGITYGSGLQNLKYRNERVRTLNQSSSAVDVDPTKIQRIGYIALLVLPSYLHARLRDRMLMSSWADEPLPRSWLSFLSPIKFVRVITRPTSDEAQRYRLECKRISWELLNLSERLVAVATLANFLVFLYDGRYRTLVDRILGMRLIYAHRSIKPNVSFEFLNRQLVWEAFTEFLLFLMPLISVRKLRTRFARIITNGSQKYRLLALLVSSLPQTVLKSLKLEDVRRSNGSRGGGKSNASQLGADGKPLQRPQGTYGFLPPTTCPICYALSNAPPTAIPSNPTNLDSDRGNSVTSTTMINPSNYDTSVKIPYVTNCGWECRYCYYCVVEKLALAEEDGKEGWECMRCGQEVNGANRERKDSIEQDEEKPEQDLLAPEDGDELDGEAELLEGDAEEQTAAEIESIGSEHDRWRS